jgi:hypothetical protein
MEKNNTQVKAPTNSFKTLRPLLPRARWGTIHCISENQQSMINSNSNSKRNILHSSFAVFSD